MANAGWDAIVRVTEYMGEVVESYLEKGKQIKKIYDSVPVIEDPNTTHWEYRCEKCNQYKAYPIRRTDITYSEDPNKLLSVKWCYKCLHHYMCLVH